MRTTSVSLVTRSKDFAATGIWKVLEFLPTLGRAWVPEKYGAFEPLRAEYDVGLARRLAQTAEAQRSPLLVARRAKPRYLLNFWPGLHGKPSSMHLSMHHADATSDELVRFCHAACDSMKPELAFVHNMTDAEARLATGHGDAKAKLPAGMLVEEDLQGAPMTYWGMYAGPRFSAQVPRELLDADGIVVEERNGGIWIQMSPTLSDLKTDFDTIWARREALRFSVGPRLFRDGCQ